MKTLKILTVIIIFLSITLYAQDNNIEKHPGYFEFGELSSLDQGEEGAEIFIEEHLLKMVAKFSKHEDEELAALLNGLKLVKVNTFEVSDRNAKALKDKLNSIQTTLKNNKWDRIIRIRENGEDMNVFLKTDRNKNINGLVIAGVGSDEKAIFVNIVGDIDLEAIGKLGEKFDIPSLGNINGKKKN
ncbi:MAG: DUF4252 domain-containing protein [Ignavibacteriaceae bacterium]